MRRPSRSFGSAEVFQRVCVLLLHFSWLTLHIHAEGQTEVLSTSFTEPTSLPISTAVYNESSQYIQISNRESLTKTIIPSPTAVSRNQTFHSTLSDYIIASSNFTLANILSTESPQVEATESTISSSPFVTESVHKTSDHHSSHVIMPSSTVVMATSILTTVTVVTTKVTTSAPGPNPPWGTTPSIVITTGNGNFSGVNDTETMEYNGKGGFQFSTPVIVGIAGGSAAFVVILVGLVFCCCKQSRRSRSYSATSKTNLSSFWDDNINLSYINGHIELPMDYNDEMVSLDNDSFLNSLDSMSFTNLWTADSAKSTNF